MKVVGLVSGGKDSCYAMMKCIEYGHEIVALANLMPLDDSIDELDSYMYQTVGHQIVVSYAECMGLPLFRRRIHGSTRHQNLSYRTTEDDEVEDMFILLAEVKQRIPSVAAVSSGAIASDYQRLRVENVCSRLGLVSLAYLWKQDQSLLLQEMITKGIIAITVKVAAMGLNPEKHLGKEIAHLQDQLHALKEMYGINVCGEGGEYETLTLDCPLFENAQIVLDGFQVVLHSSDSIAPVGVLHPSAFHLDYKRDFFSSNNNTDNACPNQIAYVFEVQGVNVSNGEAKCSSQDFSSEFVPVRGIELQTSKTRRDNAYSICCWIHDPCGTSDDLQRDLSSILKKIESELVKDGFGWVNVFYIHLYIADMNEFTLANETYINYITEEKCPFGVPSRSTIELPLKQVGLGKAYIEVLVANDLTKRVLHVQSISCWAPSCIGPYSQATLHKGILYMAGQLGLDPPTMKLCHGGATTELEQALENCEAVAQSFKCSLSSSTILFVIYCSASLSFSQRTEIQEKFDGFLELSKISEVEKSGISKLLSPVLLYVLAPNLPKSALVEIKPTLYVQEEKEENEIDTGEPSCITTPSYWGFEKVPFIESFCQKYVIRGKICLFTLNIVNEVAKGICCEPFEDLKHESHPGFGTKKHMKRISRFCIYVLDQILLENDFSWGDIMSLRFYYPVSHKMSLDVLSIIFTDAFDEFTQIRQRIDMIKEPMFNLVPVAGAGKSALSMDDILTCELFASKL